MQVVLQSDQILDTDNLATGREAIPDGLSRQVAAVVRNDQSFMAQTFCYIEDYPISWMDAGDDEYAQFPNIQLINYRLTSQRDFYS